jgi:hypothetical protein
MPIELEPTAGGPDVLPNPLPASDPQPPEPDPTPEPSPAPPYRNRHQHFRHQAKGISGSRPVEHLLSPGLER